MFEKKIADLVSIEEFQQNQEVFFYFNGKLDSNKSQLMSDHINNHLEQISRSGFDKDTLRITFDLNHVTFVSSFFMRVCFQVLRTVKKGNFEIMNCSQDVNSLLKLSGLDKLVSIITKEVDSLVIKSFENFSRNANINDLEEYLKEYNRSINDPENFWAEQAKEYISWYEAFDKTLEWELPFSKWFFNGKLNVCYNCLDKHIGTDIADKTALIWESESVEDGYPQEKLSFTYRELLSEVSLFSNVLKEMGVSKGDRVIIYMPMIPEAVFAMLACARIGAIHSVIFAGFSPQAIAERAEDCQATVIITSDQSYRRGKLIPLKDNVDKAIEILDSGDHSKSLIKKVLLIERTGNKVNLLDGRDLKYSEMIKAMPLYCEPEIMDSEDVLFILYTSGSTGKPKGVFHSSAGYLLGAHLTFKNIMDIKKDDIYWSSADIGWITGHTYTVYGPFIQRRYRLYVRGRS
jgi:anti-anti-sigma factor